MWTIEKWKLNMSLFHYENWMLLLVWHWLMIILYYTLHPNTTIVIFTAFLLLIDELLIDFFLDSVSLHQKSFSQKIERKLSESLLNISCLLMIFVIVYSFHLHNVLRLNVWYVMISFRIKNKILIINKVSRNLKILWTNYLLQNSEQCIIASLCGLECKTLNNDTFSLLLHQVTIGI